MDIKLEGKPAFAYAVTELAPGESIIAESDAMASMDAALQHKVSFNGGFFPGLMKRFFGGESLFVNHYTNVSNEPKRIVFTQSTPGDMLSMNLNGNTFYLQPGAYICSTPDVKLGLAWAGFASFFGGEGLFRLAVSGNGTVVFGAYGGILEKHVEGEYLVDTSHLVGYEPQMNVSLQLAGGIFSSFFGGEGLVMKIKGSGKIYIQTRSVEGLAGWINKLL
jgi:uncharacterized protein (TIGR00266 family)